MLNIYIYTYIHIYTYRVCPPPSNSSHYIGICRGSLQTNLHMPLESCEGATPHISICVYVYIYDLAVPGYFNQFIWGLLWFSRHESFKRKHRTYQDKSLPSTFTHYRGLDLAGTLNFTRFIGLHSSVSSISHGNCGAQQHCDPGKCYMDSSLEQFSHLSLGEYINLLKHNRYHHLSAVTYMIPGITPRKINIEPGNDGLEDDFPLPGMPSQVPC